MLLAVSLCLPPSALAEEALSSDALLRQQLRLSDLGYYTTSVTGRNDALYENALSAFQAENALDTSVFARDAAASAYQYAARTDLTMLFGMPGEWSQIEELLTEGSAYAVTSRVSGVAFQMTYLGGGAHAHFASAADWDAQTLVGQFGGLDRLAPLPIVLSVDGTRVSASLSGRKRTLADGGSAYCVYFSGAASTFGGLEDQLHLVALDLADGD